MNWRQLFQPMWEPMPRPSMSTPLAATDTGDPGNDPDGFAMGRHVHPSRIRKEIKPVAGGSATSFLATWVYPTAFDVGVVPVVNGCACATGSTDTINVQLEGDPTNTQAVFRISRYSQTLVGLLSLTILALQPVGTIKLHCEAYQP